MDRKPKIVFQLDSPFTATQWPQITPQNQDTILEVLCSLLSQIGQHRSTQKIAPSKGKRSKRRKRQEAKAEDAETISPPPPPELSKFLAVGLNSITRTLEFSSRRSRPKNELLKAGDRAIPERKGFEPDPNRFTEDRQPLIYGHFSAIFVCRSSRPTVLHAHLPQLVVTASLAYPELPVTRLVELPVGSEARLCGALGLPSVSSIGILERAPHSKALVDLLRECVPDIEIPWLQQMKSPKYLPVKINAIETFSTNVQKSKA